MNKRYTEVLELIKQNKLKFNKPDKQLIIEHMAYVTKESFEENRKNDDSNSSWPQKNSADLKRFRDVMDYQKFEAEYMNKPVRFSNNENQTSQDFTFENSLTVADLKRLRCVLNHQKTKKPLNVADLKRLIIEMSEAEDPEIASKLSKDLYKKMASLNTMQVRKTLHLSVSDKPFEVMVTGEKRDEFRACSDWIKSRLYHKDGRLKDYDVVKIVNGYGNHRPYFIASFLGFYQLRDEINEVLKYSNGLIVSVNLTDYIIQLGEIIETGNLKD